MKRYKNHSSCSRFLLLRDNLNVGRSTLFYQFVTKCSQSIEFQLSKNPIHSSYIDSGTNLPCYSILGCGMVTGSTVSPLVEIQSSLTRRVLKIKSNDAFIPFITQHYNFLGQLGYLICHIFYTWFVLENNHCLGYCRGNINALISRARIDTRHIFVLLRAEPFLPEYKMCCPKLLPDFFSKTEKYVFPQFFPKQRNLFSLAESFSPLPLA